MINAKLTENQINQQLQSQSSNQSRSLLASTLNLLEWERLCQQLSTFAATKLGAIAARNLRIPTTSAESLHLLALTQEIYSLEQQSNSNWTFGGIKDIGEALERAKIGGIIAAKDLLDIATTLAGIRRLRRAIEATEFDTLKAMVEPLRTYPEIETEIHRCIEDSGEVAERASPKLGEIRRRIKTYRGRIYSTLQRIMQRHPGAIQEAVITQRGDRFVIPVKAPQKDTVGGIVHDVSGTGSTLYIEPSAVVELGNQLRQATRQEQREEEIILGQLSEQIAAVYTDLEELLAAAISLDLATAKARYSLWLEANPPRFVENQTERINLKNLRHPLLVWQQRHEQGSEVVPINATVQPGIKVVAITGPNTGGKTVTLKSFGLAALMAKVGLFVPAQAPVEIPWFEHILADIGDEQSLQQSLSTFSGHIRRISRIVDLISSEGSNVLVLLDEVGAGTDPTEGSALAISLLKYLADTASLTIATTHYGELKALKYEDERFENASVEFDDTTLQPTYRLLWGIPGRSNALAIAARLGLKGEIVEAAKTTLGGSTEDVNQVISALESQRREQETKAQQAQDLLQKTEQFYQEVSQKAQSLKAREQELKQQQQQAVAEAIAEAKAEIAKVIRGLQQAGNPAQAAQQATQAIDRIADQQLAPAKAAKPAYKPQVGERVKIPSVGQTGEVLAIDNEQQLTVRFGIMKMTLSMNEIESLDGQKVETPPKPPKSAPGAAKSKPASISTVRTSSNTLDLRGSRVADAEIELDRAIAGAIAAGSHVLWIIHGKGTGKLRQGVHEFLRQHGQIEKFELAPQNEGGAGATIAYLI